MTPTTVALVAGLTQGCAPAWTIVRSSGRRRLSRKLIGGLSRSVGDAGGAYLQAMRQ